MDPVFGDRPAGGLGGAGRLIEIVWPDELEPEVIHARRRPGVQSNEVAAPGRSEERERCADSKLLLGADDRLEKRHDRCRSATVRWMRLSP